MAEIKDCPICHKSFMAKRIDKLCCSQNCASLLSKWRRGIKKRPYVRKLSLPVKYVPISNFDEVEAYLLEMKSKSFYADMVDLYRLVHVYDLCYPDLQSIPHSNEIEKCIETMFMKVCIWYKNNKKEGQAGRKKQ